MTDQRKPRRQPGGKSRQKPEVPRTRVYNLFDWRRLVASKRGPTQPTTRHVLHMIDFHLKGKSGQLEPNEECYPSQETIADMTGFSVECVNRHLAVAFREGWIGRREVSDPSRGKGHKVCYYWPTIPTRILIPVDELDPRSSPTPELDRGSDQLDPEPVLDLIDDQGNSLVGNSPRNSTEALANASERRSRVEKVDSAKPQPTCRPPVSENAVGFLMATWRQLLGEPGARDADVFRTLLAGGRKPENISSAIEGLASMKALGELVGISADEKLAARFLLAKREGRTMLQIGEDFFWARLNRSRSSPPGFATTASILSSAARPP